MCVSYIIVYQGVDHHIVAQHHTLLNRLIESNFQSPLVFVQVILVAGLLQSLELNCARVCHFSESRPVLLLGTALRVIRRQAQVDWDFVFFEQYIVHLFHLRELHFRVDEQYVSRGLVVLAEVFADVEFLGLSSTDSIPSDTNYRRNRGSLHYIRR